MGGLYKTGLVHIYYGDGKGKTSAAVGLAMRAAGCGGRVLFAQFLKNGRSGELRVLRSVDGVHLLEGKPCMKFLRDMDDGERAQACKDQLEAFRLARELALSGEYDLLVLDEVIDAVDLGLIQQSELLGFLREKPAQLEAALTGHKVFAELLDCADYVSEVRKIKHPYDKGTLARKGAEF